MLLNYKAKRAKRDRSVQEKEVVEHDLAKYLEPIANLLETILSNKIKLLLISQQGSFNQAQAESLLVILDCIMCTISKPEASPCLHFQLLKLIKLVVIDQKDEQLCQLFAQRFVSEQGLQILLYLCQNACTFDVKSYCVKIIDVLCTTYTSLIKTIRIDTDLISYLSDIIIPKRFDCDIEKIKKKRFDKLLRKRKQEYMDQQKMQLYLSEKAKKIQIVDYQVDQQLDLNNNFGYPNQNSDRATFNKQDLVEQSFQNDKMIRTLTIDQ